MDKTTDEAFSENSMTRYDCTVQQTLLSTLKIAIGEATKQHVVARMPVGPKVHQSFGVLHGGASVALAETAASIGGLLNVDQSKETVVGLEINANHLRTKRDGVLTATATPIHVGRRTQVWDIRITDEEDKLICVSRCTLAVVPKPSSANLEAAVLPSNADPQMSGKGDEGVTMLADAGNPNAQNHHSQEHSMSEHSRELSKDEPIRIAVQENQHISGQLRRSSDGRKWALICRGLTGSLERRSSLDDLADALDLQGCSSLRFDYRHSLKPETGESLRTALSMVEDIKAAIGSLTAEAGSLPDVVIARGYGAEIALEVLVNWPEIPLIMWAPILWLRTSLELRGRLHEMRRNGTLRIDGTDVGDDFIASIQDATDAELASWIVPQRRHIIVQGLEDKVVPMSLAVESRDLIESAGGKVDLLVLQGGHPHPGMDVRLQIEKIVETVERLS